MVIVRAVIPSLEENGQLISKSSRCITTMHAVVGDVQGLLQSYSSVYLAVLSHLKIRGVEKLASKYCLLPGHGDSVFLVSEVANLLQVYQK